MNKLYTSLARVYHGMYREIFDYDREFERCDLELKKYGKHSVVEVGCGGGRLAARFTLAGYNYLGVDIHEEMLEIARRENPGVRFVRGDMKNLALTERFEAVIVTGRSFSMMISNDDVMAALASFNRLLEPGGVLVFDNFKADAIIPKLAGSENVESVQAVQCSGFWVRRTNWTRLSLSGGWTWDWRAEYRIRTPGAEDQIVCDDTRLRAFTEDEIILFLRLSRFRVVENKPGDILWIVAEKE